jgi:hypothetical protein
VGDVLLESRFETPQEHSYALIKGILLQDIIILRRLLKHSA